MLSPTTDTTVRYRFPKALAVIAVALCLQGHRPFLFEHSLDLVNNWTKFDNAGTMNWNIGPVGSGFIRADTLSGFAEGWLIRQNDTENDAIIRVRSTSAAAANGAAGLIANRQTDTQFYLALGRWDTNLLQIFLRNPGFALLSSKSFTLTTGVFYEFEFTTLDNGGNKDLELSMDGTSELTTSTGTQLGAGGAAIYSVMFSSAANVRHDFFTFNTKGSMGTLGAGAK